MTTNGHKLETAADVLRWPGQVVSAVDLVRHLNGQSRLLLSGKAILTPNAIDELGQRGVTVERESDLPALAPSWGYGQDWPHATVHSAIQALEREGLRFRPLSESNGGSSASWARHVAECVSHGACSGGVIFCEDPALVCCVANKVAGLRAATVTTLGQLGRALEALAPNLIAVEMPGRTFFEVRQILRTVSTTRACPDGVACTLKELDGHAHR
jgi:hypothetical protein